jgi:hypothetical protein
VKGDLMGYRTENRSELLAGIQVIVRAILGETLVEIFLEWIKQLQRRFDMNGEFVG